MTIRKLMVGPVCVAKLGNNLINKPRRKTGILHTSTKSTTTREQID